MQIPVDKIDEIIELHLEEHFERRDITVPDLFSEYVRIFFIRGRICANKKILRI